MGLIYDSSARKVALELGQVGQVGLLLDICSIMLVKQCHKPSQIAPFL